MITVALSKRGGWGDDVSGKYLSDFSMKKYHVGNHYKHLRGASSKYHNLYFCGETRKISLLFG